MLFFKLFRFYKNDFQSIKDSKNIDHIEFDDKVKDFSFTNLNLQKNSDFNLESFFDDKKTEKWKKQIFPLDYVQLSHNPANLSIKEKIDNEWKQLKNKAVNILS